MAWLGWDPPECQGCSGCVDCTEDYDPGPAPEPAEALHASHGWVTWTRRDDE